MGDEIQRLVTVWDANTQRIEAKLNSLVRSNYAAARQVENSWQRVRVGITDQALNAATSGVGALGGVLTRLGPAGIAAAAGIAAMTAAVHQAARVAEWSEDLGDVANQLHLTTTRLQEMDFAATAAGAPVEAMRTSLQGLQSAMGAALSGTDRAGRRFRAIFQELGISPEQLRNLSDVTELLPLIAQGLSRVSSARAARIGELLRINPEILHELEQGRDRITDLTTAAQRYGVVIDASVIERNARAADSMRLARAVIDQELRVAFSNLTPVIDGTSTAFVQMIGRLNEFLARASDAVGVIETMSRGLLNIPRDIAIRLQISAQANPGTGFPEWAAASAQGVINRSLPPGLREALTVGMNAARTERDRGTLGGEILNNQMMGLLGQIPRSAAQSPATESAGAGGSRRRRGKGGHRAAVDPLHGMLPQWTFPAADRDALINLDNLEGQIQEVATSGLRDAAGELAAGLQEHEEETRQSIQDAVQGGLEAAFRDGWPGLLQWAARQLTQTLTTSLSSTIANVLMGAGGGQFGKDGNGNIFATIARAFIGHNAGGTNNWPGGLSWVGERGPEIVNLPRGAQVMPAGVSAAMAQARDARLYMTINLDGANGDQTIRRIAYQAAAEGAQRTLALARRQAPGWVAQRQAEGR